MLRRKQKRRVLFTSEKPRQRDHRKRQSELPTAPKQSCFQIEQNNNQSSFENSLRNSFSNTPYNNPFQPQDTQNLFVYLVYFVVSKPNPKPKKGKNKMTAPKFITMEGSSHLTDKPFYVGLVQHESVMTRKRQKRLRTAGAFFVHVFRTVLSRSWLRSPS